MPRKKTKKRAFSCTIRAGKYRESGMQFDVDGMELSPTFNLESLELCILHISFLSSVFCAIFAT